MAAVALTTVQILAALTEAGVNITELRDKLHKDGKHEHARTLEQLQNAAAQPGTEFLWR